MSETIKTIVVSYRNSTSNHNSRAVRGIYGWVVSYRNSTSNHNLAAVAADERSVVSYRNSTSNHNPTEGRRNVILVVSYRNSTSNHNSCLCISEETALYLIEILHQTTTLACWVPRPCCCILSKFYIKPQRKRCRWYGISRCILSKFYIKPQLLLVY